VRREFDRCVENYADPAFHPTVGVRFRQHVIQHFGMSFRSRCQRAGGIPLHLQEETNRRIRAKGNPVNAVWPGLSR
jgi:hypothetical protein